MRSFLKILFAPDAGRKACRALNGIGTDHREKNTGMSVVGRDFAAGDRHQTHTGVAHLKRNDLREVSGDLLGDTLAAAGLGFLHKNFGLF